MGSASIKELAQAMVTHSLNFFLGRPNLSVPLGVSLIENTKLIMKKLLALLTITLFSIQSKAQSDQSEMGFLRFEASAGLYTTKDIRNNIKYNTPDVWGINGTATYFGTLSFFRYRKVEVGIGFGYQDGKTPSNSDLDVTYYTFLPQTRLNWVTSDDGNFELYSTYAVGVTSVNEDDQSTFNQDVSYLVPAFHVNAIGMRFGNTFGGFMELGFGAKGFMSAGLSLRF